MGISFGVLILQGLEIGTAASGTEAHFQISFWMAVGLHLIDGPRYAGRIGTGLSRYGHQTH